MVTDNSSKFRAAMGSGTDSSTSNLTAAPVVLKNVGNKNFTTGLNLDNRISDDFKRRRGVINDDDDVDEEVQNTA